MKSLALLVLFAAVAYAAPVAESSDFDGIELLPEVQKLYQSNVTYYGGQTRQVRGNAKYSICGGDDTIRLNNLVIPDKIKLPGKLPISFDAELTRQYDNLAVELKIEKKLGFYISAPCMKIGGNSIGSCTYDDVCYLYKKALAESPAVIDTVTSQLSIPTDHLCPFLPLKLDGVKTEFDLPAVPIGGALGWFASGKYKVTIKVYDYPISKKRLVFCMSLELDVDM